MKYFSASFTSVALAFSLGMAVVSAVASDSRSAVQGPAASDIHWQGFDEGLKDAAKRDKYTFIDVYTDWCGYCHKMDLTTFRDKAVVSKLAREFVSIKFNAESESPVTWKGARLTQAELAGKLGVEGFPTLLFLSPKGELIGNFASFADSDLLIKLLGYISSGSREKGKTFDEYLKKEPS
jgi:thioredoxin-related protein